jgi:hypothetical protein
VQLRFDHFGEMYLAKGWKAFAREHDIAAGHFVVFGYDGGGVLTVKVFDHTMCRRQYNNDSDDE